MVFYSQIRKPREIARPGGQNTTHNDPVGVANSLKLWKFAKLRGLGSCFRAGGVL
jgi:hypothetical protein